jgi:hypothetical protein
MNISDFSERFVRSGIHRGEPAGNLLQTKVTDEVDPHGSRVEAGAAARLCPCDKVSKSCSTGLILKPIQPARIQYLDWDTAVAPLLHGHPGQGKPPAPAAPRKGSVERCRKTEQANKIV